MSSLLPIDTLIARARANPDALARLAAILMARAEWEAGTRAALAALDAGADDPELVSRVQQLLARRVPSWHFSIVRDQARNAAYDAALRRAVGPESRVLEIGTGSGILAMMAARAGAGAVVTCEMSPEIAATATEIVARNGYADRVKVIAKPSFELDADTDLGGRADVYVSEIVSNTIVGQGALAVTEHAVAQLLQPGARIIPARGIVRVALAHHPRFDTHRIGIEAGFDLTPLNRLAPISHLLKRGDPQLQRMSAAADLFDFDFQSGGPYPANAARVELTAERAGANGVAQWIALQMDAEGWYENDPQPGAESCWAVLFWPFAHTRKCPAGSIVPICGQHDRNALRIW